MSYAIYDSVNRMYISSVSGETIFYIKEVEGALKLPDRSSGRNLLNHLKLRGLHIDKV